MTKKEQEKRRKGVIEEYSKGTKLALIMGFFSITKGGIYYILDRENIQKKRKHLTRFK